MRSRTGFSGSPVFVYRTPGSNIKESVEHGQSYFGEGFLFLLGINWGGFNEKWELVDEGVEAEGASTINLVIPAWRITEMLEREEFVKQREEDEKVMPAANGPTNQSG